MTTYIALFNLTDAGIKAAKDSPRRLDAAKKLLADMGGEMKHFVVDLIQFPLPLPESDFARFPYHNKGRGHRNLFLLISTHPPVKAAGCDSNRLALRSGRGPASTCSM